ncbi:MAG: sulfatase activating formylglycine-generating enzyme [Verrucomicrobiales bacterium]|jgi:formylglycine-generating enzyme required for sulfatase activity
MPRCPFYQLVSITCALAFPTGFASAYDDDKIDFEKQIAPILETSCLKCHGSEKPKGKYSIVTKETAFADGMIVSGDPDKGDFYWLLITDDKDEVMPPPKDDGGTDPLTDEQKELVRLWIEQGAEWPDGVEIGKKKGPDFQTVVKPILDKLSPGDRQKLREWVAAGAEWPAENPDTVELTETIRKKVVAETKVKSADKMAAYTETIPETGVTFDLVAIPGGGFIMGSPDGEPGRASNEGPAHEVQVDPFWMAKFEVTWSEYNPFMVSDDRRTKPGAKYYPDPKDTVIDMVSRPTKPFMPMNFGMPTDGHPAIAMTQHAASKYCQWLTAQTGHYYRLPTEAEWEYACRAGTTTTWSWGDDPNQAGEYAWFVDNANFQYQKVGQKKPNPWGLHDMHGNVGEWVLDYFHSDGYISVIEAGKPRKNPWVMTDKLYPRSVRGGSWAEPLEKLRSAVRLASDTKWKMQDPQFPKSIWYHTEPKTLGFRVVRPLNVPDAETMFKMWNSGIEHDGMQE